jgi:hypothetical protein
MPNDLPSFAQQMLAKYQALLLKGAGLQSVSVDGQSVSVVDLETKWQFWATKVARETGAKPVQAVIRMGGV